MVPGKRGNGWLIDQSAANNIIMAWMVDGGGTIRDRSEGREVW
jgi:hypothetical protein